MSRILAATFANKFKTTTPAPLHELWINQAALLLSWMEEQNVAISPSGGLIFVSWGHESSRRTLGSNTLVDALRAAFEYDIRNS